MNPSRSGESILRVAVVGCGKMSRNHAKAISLCNGAELIAAADPGITYEDLPDWFGDQVQFFNDTDEMLTVAKPDIVHIVTPPNTHFEITRMVLDSGAHAYVEKPFIGTLAEAEEIFQVARDKGLKVCAGHQLLFTRPAKQLQDLLESIGEAVHIESYFSFNTVRRSISPTDQLIDILPHATYLLSDILTRSSHTDDSSIEIESIWTTYDGEARALLRLGNISGALNISLAGRPVDSYVKVIGTNGTLHADFVRGYVIKSQGPGASVFSVLLIPFVQASQLFWRMTGAIFRLFSDRKKGYPGLPELVTKFYQSVQTGSAEPILPSAAKTTVAICEAIEASAKKAEEEFEINSNADLAAATTSLPATELSKGRVLVTGGTGLFGRPTAALLRKNGWPVTVLSRSIPPSSRRSPGVEYLGVDLALDLPESLLKGVETVIHAAAETTGGRSEQERNSIHATRALLKASELAGVKQFIHISSIAVLKPGISNDSKALDESSPIDLDNLSRGPYVWGKAESENIASTFGGESDMHVKIVRLGPLVDYDDYKPPGRLGREIHNLYVAMGSSKDALSVCSVQTAAATMLAYLCDFESMPSTLNLVEPNAPTRKELLERWKERRTPLHTIRLPTFVLSILSPLLVGMQKVLIRGKKPIDIKSAFSSERYDTTKAASILKREAGD